MVKIKVAGAALNQIPIHWDNNLSNIEKAVKQAKSHGADILCLPELCITGYGCEDLFLSEWLPEKALSFIPDIAEQTKNIAVAVGLPVRLNGHVYNCAAVIRDGEVLGVTAKQFLANDGVHYEPRWFTAWEPGEVTEIKINSKYIPFGDLTYDLYGVRTGFEICEDAWRSDRPACRMNNDIQLILNPSASHFAFGKSPLRVNLVIDSSKKFQCYYVYVNLLGNEAGRMIYDGEIIVAGHGKLIKLNEKLSFREVSMLVTDIDPDDKKPEGISTEAPEEDKNEMFARAASLALFDYMRKSHSRGFVLSLSGGADSSTCAVLVSEMVRRSIFELGLEKSLEKLHFSHIATLVNGTGEKERFRFVTGNLLHCAYQGTVNSSAETLESAKALAHEIGAKFDQWLIDEEITSYKAKIENVIGRKLNWDDDDITLQNIQARARSPIIWMLANIERALLLVTSNRSEADVGYATMDGDMSGSIAPIAAVDKYFILQWLRWAEKELGYKSLSYVNSLNPTAELRPPDKGQTDETDLMPYPVIVAIEKLAVRERMSPKDVFLKLGKEDLEDRELLKSHIKKFFTLWSRNQWKRERTAPAFHLDDFNVDPRTWCRFPILSSGYYDELAELDSL